MFEPAFPFDRGRAYTIRFDPRALPTPQRDTALTTVAGLPRERNLAATSVVADPSDGRHAAGERTPDVRRVLRSDVATTGREFVHLIDDGGNEVKNAFLPLDADFWNPDHTRYTIFLDPGV